VVGQRPSVFRSQEESASDLKGGRLLRPGGEDDLPAGARVGAPQDVRALVGPGGPSPEGEHVA
jgi:hypothetical protein